MGTKGRNVILFLFTAGGAGVVLGKLFSFPPADLFFLLTVVTAPLIFYYYCLYLPRARTISNKMGLKHVVLLPLNICWAKILLKLSNMELEVENTTAFELHVKAPDKLSLVTFLKLLEDDLNKVRDKLPGSLILWETSAPIPAEIRQLIRKRCRDRKAYWQKGRWPLPKPPFVELELKKGKVRHGAILLGGKKIDEKDRNHNLAGAGPGIHDSYSYHGQPRLQPGDRNSKGCQNKSLHSCRTKDTGC